VHSCEELSLDENGYAILEVHVTSANPVDSESRRQSEIDLGNSTITSADTAVTETVL